MYFIVLKNEKTLCYFTLKNIVIITQIPPFCDMLLWYLLILCIFMQSVSQSNFRPKEISQILLKPNFKAFWQSAEGFQRCGFLYPPLSRDFISPKSPGLIGLRTGDGWRGGVCLGQNLLSVTNVICQQSPCKLNEKYMPALHCVSFKISGYFLQKATSFFIFTLLLVLLFIQSLG